MHRPRLGDIVTPTRPNDHVPVGTPLYVIDRTSTDDPIVTAIAVGEPEPHYYRSSSLIRLDRPISGIVVPMEERAGSLVRLAPIGLTPCSHAGGAQRGAVARLAIDFRVTDNFAWTGEPVVTIVWTEPLSGSQPNGRYPSRHFVPHVGPCPQDRPLSARQLSLAVIESLRSGLPCDTPALSFEESSPC